MEAASCLSKSVGLTQLERNPVKHSNEAFGDIKMHSASIYSEKLAVLFHQSQQHIGISVHQSIAQTNYQ